MTKKLLNFALLITAVVVILFGARWLGFDQLLTLDGMRAWLESWSPYGPLAFIGLCIVGIVLYLPESLLLMLGGALFGGWTAFVYGWVATVIGTTVTFLIARYLARDYVQRTFLERRENFRRMDERFSEHGLIWVFLLRTVLGLAPPLNWAVALTSVSFRNYFLGTALGVIPNVGTFVYFGRSMADAGESGIWMTPQVILAAVLVAGVVAVGIFAGRRMFLGKSGE